MDVLCVWLFGVLHMHTHTHYSVLYKLNTTIDRLGSVEMGLLVRRGLNAAISSVPSSSFLYEMFHIDPLKNQYEHESLFTLTSVFMH